MELKEDKRGEGKGIRSEEEIQGMMYWVEKSLGEWRNEGEGYKGGYTAGVYDALSWAFYGGKIKELWRWR